MLTSLESAVIEKFLAREGEAFTLLRAQLPHLTVVDRKFTGVGFFTDFVLSPGASVRPAEIESPLSGVAAQLPGLEHSVGFLLFLERGVIHTLEAYTHADDQWPEKTDEFRIFTTAA